MHRLRDLDFLNPKIPNPLFPLQKNKDWMMTSTLQNIEQLCNVWKVFPLHSSFSMDVGTLKYLLSISVVTFRLFFCLCFSGIVSAFNRLDHSQWCRDLSSTRVSLTISREIFDLIFVEVVILNYSLSVISVKVSPCAKWNQTGVTIAGTNGVGNSSNQLNGSEDIFIHKPTNICMLLIR